MENDLITLKPKIVAYFDIPLLMFGFLLPSIVFLFFGYIFSYFILKSFGIILPMAGTFNSAQEFYDILFKIFGLILIIDLILTFRSFVILKRTEYYLKDDRISFKRGGYRTTMNDTNKDILYKNILGVQVVKYPFYKKYNIGTIRILDLLDKNSFKRRILEQIENPNQIKKIINERRSAAGAPMEKIGREQFYDN